jgi:hypothetical protein
MAMRVQDTRRGGNMRIDLDRSELGTGSNGLEIAVKGFAGYQNAQIYVEIYNDKLQVHVWDGSQEDPVSQTSIPEEAQ